MPRRRAFTLLALLALSLCALTGCNTMRGVGQDIQMIGKGWSETADRANPYGP